MSQNLTRNMSSSAYTGLTINLTSMIFNGQEHEKLLVNETTCYRISVVNRN